MKPLRIGTRGSALALWQANHFREALQETCGLDSEIVVIKTSGDQNVAVPAQQIGVIGIFTKELEDSLLDGRADLAVHSMKDVPTEFSPACRIATVFKREDPRDALVSARGETLAQLPHGALHRHQQSCGALRNCVRSGRIFRLRNCAATWIRACAKLRRANTTRSCWRKRALIVWDCRRASRKCLLRI